MLKKQIKPSNQPIMIETEYNLIPDRNYADFINDILFEIRRGRTEYCYYVYQVMDLLRFEYDTLNVEWLANKRCFRVSLIFY